MIKIVSANVRGVADKQKRKAIFEAQRNNADILILQETHSKDTDEKLWEYEWGGDALYSHGTSAAKGVGVFMVKGMKKYVSNIFRDLDGRCIIFDLKVNETTISVAAIYAPNYDSPTFYKQVETELEKRQENKIIIGDFNLTLEVDIDRKNTYNNNSKARDVLVDMMDQFSLRDIWRVQNEEKREYSWHKSGNINMASRIDFALVSGGLDQNVKEILYLPSIMSDHRPLYLLVEVNYVERGKGYWKFNNSYLQNIEFVEGMNKEIEATIASCENRHPVDTWEILKSRIKKYTVGFARTVVSEQNIVIGNLSEKLNEYFSKLPLDKRETELMEKTQKDLDEKMMEKAKAMLFRSKARWHELGEKSTKYFFSLEKARYNAKTCFKLLDQEGLEICDSQKILEAQRKYYQKLYEEDTDVEFTMQNIYDIKVKEEKRLIQEEQITMEEVEEAIKCMNNNKTPGEDGISVDFYKVFWSRIKVLFMSMINENFERKMLHESARKGILNLIPKPNKDSRCIKNLRPITLLNTDYKIIEKVIANKMIPSLEDIINKDQRGFMQNRRIAVNIRKMLDIMKHVETEDLEAVILSLDFVKCFDKCSFSILHGSLDFFGFGSIVKQWTRILYRGFTVKVQNNGCLSTPIQINKGVHQGGCCSSIYFLVIAEILALSLRANEDIDGITIQDIRNLLNQFADDMDICTICNERSIRNICSELHRFYYQSGFTVSYEKTTLYRIGSLRHSCAQLYNIDEYVWSNKDIVVLGVTVSHEDIIQKNYEPVICKARQLLSSWFNRGLSLIGKIQVVNTLIASLFVYKMMVLPLIPQRIIKGVENIIRDYIWSGKKAKISFKILQNKKCEGGLDLVNLRCKEISLKATWPQILAQEDDYSVIVYKGMRCGRMQQDIWRCTLLKEDVSKLKMRSEFWRDTLMCWCEYNFYKDFRIENQVIWYNSYIRSRNKTIYWAHCHSKGLFYVHQLFENKSFITSQQAFERYGLTCLCLNTLKIAVPKEWREFFMSYDKREYMPLPPHTYDVCVYGQVKQLSRRIYTFLCGDLMEIHNKYVKWTEELGQELCTNIVEFGYLHRKVFSLTNIPKFRSFQYRLLQRSIITNTLLFKWKLCDTELCSFCQEERETVLHMLCECKIVKELWQEISEYLEEKYQFKVDINKKNILLNTVSKDSKIINFVCLLSKIYIYRQRCLKMSINLQGIKMFVSSVENLEKYIACKNGKVNQHEKKWGSITQSQGSFEQYIEQYCHEL